MADNLRKYTTQEVLNKVYTDSSGDSIGINSSTTKETLNAVFDETDNSLNVALSGGTISGDVTIEGDLTVNGNGTGNYDEIVNGNLVISSGNKLGVGTDDPQQLVHLKSTNAFLAFTDDADNGQSGILYRNTSGTNVGFTAYDFTNNNYKIRVNNNIALTIDSNRNVGIGTENPVAKLVVSDGGNAGIELQPEIATDTNRITNYDRAASAYMNLRLDALTQQFLISGSEKMRLDSNGNVGIGVTPQSGWQSSYTALQLSNSVLYNNGGNDLFLGANFYFDGSNNKYITADGRASAIGLADGALKFFVSSSTTHSADDNVSFNQALTIANDGLATFSDNIASSRDNFTISANSGLLQLRTLEAGQNMLFDTGGDFLFRDVDDSNATRLTIESGTGNVGIGKSTLESTDSNWVSLELGGNGALINHSASGAGKAFIVSQNAYMVSNNFNTGMDYMDTDEASCYLQHSGTHTFRVASSGTADASITWTDALAIANDSSATFAGDLTIGTTGNNGFINLKRSSDGVTVGGLGLSSTNVLDFSVSGGSTPLIQSIIGGTTIMKLDTDSRISLSNNDSGSSNTLFGFRAGNAIADAGNTGNVLIGHNAGKVANNADFHYNVAIGYAALQSVGSRNLKNVVAIGTNTMRSCDSGAPDGTVAIGGDALYSLTTGEKNVSIGFESMLYQTDGANNTVLGYNALRNADNGESDNVVIGKEAGININHASADANVIIGSNAGFGGNAPISGAVVIGANAMNSTGGNTITGAVAIGYNSLTALTSGANNVAMGYQSGDTITTGSGNTIIGTYADASANAQNQIVIGHNVTGLADNSVTVGNASVTNVYLSTDRDARLHCGGVDLGEASDSSDAHVLDDYEEGTWTPTFVSASGHAPTISATYVNDFTKVGNVVTVSLYIAFGNDGGGTDGVQISGLPTAIPANTFHMVPAVFRRTNFTSNIMQYGLTVASTDDIGFYYTNATGDRVGLTYDDIDVSSNNLILTFTYLDA